MSESKPKIALDNRHFFCGNIVSGSVQQCHQFQNVQLIFTAEMFQHWTTSSGSKRKRRTHHHRLITPIKNLIIPIDPNSGRFQFQLDYACVPSLDIEKCRIRYFLKATDSSGSESEPAPFVVLSPLQAAQWAADTSRSETRDADLKWCCCCSNGKINNNFFISKTAIALDRDQPTVQVFIDLTLSEEDASEFGVVLTAKGKTKIGHVCEFSEQVGIIKVPAEVKLGEKKMVQATISLKPTAAPSFSSEIVDIEHFLTATVYMAGIFSAPVNATVPVFCAASVIDSPKFQQHWQNKTVFDPNADHATPVMYQPPKDQEHLETLPPKSFDQEQDSSSGNNVEETHQRESVKQTPAQA